MGADVTLKEQADLVQIEFWQHDLPAQREFERTLWVLSASVYPDPHGGFNVTYRWTKVVEPEPGPGLVVKSTWWDSVLFWTLFGLACIAGGIAGILWGVT